MARQQGDLAWRIGGPQDSGVDTAAVMFARACALGGLHLSGRREYYSNIMGRHSYYDVRVAPHALTCHRSIVDLATTFETEALVRHTLAVVTLAALINALKTIGKTREEVTIAMIGTGAANIAVFRVMMAAGFPPGHMIMVDTKGILHAGRDDLRTPQNAEKRRMCEVSNQDGRTGGIPKAMQGADVCIALSRSGPDVIQPQWVASMATDAMVFACANPVPEIWPWEAKEAGARIVATGCSDFPNQVNNSLVFLGIFRGVLDAAARKITDEMCIAAAEELAKCGEEKGLSAEYILRGVRLD